MSVHLCIINSGLFFLFMLSNECSVLKQSDFPWWHSADPVCSQLWKTCCYIAIISVGRFDTSLLSRVIVCSNNIVAILPLKDVGWKFLPRSSWEQNEHQGFGFLFWELTADFTPLRHLSCQSRPPHRLLCLCKALLYSLVEFLKHFWYIAPDIRIHPTFFSRISSTTRMSNLSDQ